VHAEQQVVQRRYRSSTALALSLFFAVCVFCVLTFMIFMAALTIVRTARYVLLLFFFFH